MKCMLSIVINILDLRYRVFGGADVTGNQRALARKPIGLMFRQIGSNYYSINLLCSNLHVE